MVAGFALLGYFALAVGLSVYSTRVSAFVLVCLRVLSEVGIFLFGLGFFILTFSGAGGALVQNYNDSAELHVAMLLMMCFTFEAVQR